LKTLNKDGIIAIGFKAEKDVNSAVDNAKKALSEKNINAICLNILKENNNFGSDKNKISFISNNDIKEIPLLPKVDVAFKILEFSKELDNE